MVDAKNLGSPFGMKTATTVWMGQHQKFDFILNDLNFEKNRLCTGMSLVCGLPHVGTILKDSLKTILRYDAKSGDQV